MLTTVGSISYHSSNTEINLEQYVTEAIWGNPSSERETLFAECCQKFPYLSLHLIGQVIDKAIAEFNAEFNSIVSEFDQQPIPANAPTGEWNQYNFLGLEPLEFDQECMELLFSDLQEVDKGRACSSEKRMQPRTYRVRDSLNWISMETAFFPEGKVVLNVLQPSLLNEYPWLTYADTPFVLWHIQSMQIFTIDELTTSLQEKMGKHLSPEQRTAMNVIIKGLKDTHCLIRDGRSGQMYKYRRSDSFNTLLNHLFWEFEREEHNPTEAAWMPIPELYILKKEQYFAVKEAIWIKDLGILQQHNWLGMRDAPFLLTHIKDHVETFTMRSLKDKICSNLTQSQSSRIEGFVNLLKKAGLLEGVRTREYHKTPAFDAFFNEKIQIVTLS